MKAFSVYVVVVVICATAFFIGYRYYQAEYFSGTAEPYIYNVLPQLSSWDPQQMSDYMDPGTLAKTDPRRLANLMQSLSAIGSLVEVGEPEFKNRSTGGPDEAVVISYDIETVYSSGPALVSISLIQHGDSYMVYHFNFQSAALGK